jgi:hypothetical protein
VAAGWLWLECRCCWRRFARRPPQQRRLTQLPALNGCVHEIVIGESSLWHGDPG